MDILLKGITSIAVPSIPQIIMMVVGGLLLYLGIKKGIEPTLLVPMGLGTILVNFPGSAMVTQVVNGVAEPGILNTIFDFGIATELFPLLLFIGIGAMIDFGPLLQNPFMLLFGAAAQFGIFFALIMATLFGFDLFAAASIGIIGAADGPSAIYVSNHLLTGDSKWLMGAITVVAYSYMALVPLIQPMAIKLVTTKKERMIRMPYKATGVSKTTKILFPIVICIVAGLVAPASLPLVGFLMFGNLLRECGVLDRLSATAQNELVNIISILLGFTISVQMTADKIMRPEVGLVLILGLVAFVMDTIGGVLFAKLINLFRKEKINPMIGAAGISAFPMSARVVQRLASKEDKQNFILNYAIGANVAGQIASVVAAGLILSMFAG